MLRSQLRGYDANFCNVFVQALSNATHDCSRLSKLASHATRSILLQSVRSANYSEATQNCTEATQEPTRLLSLQARKKGKQLRVENTGEKKEHVIEGEGERAT